jgi:hypothetical protein
MWLGQDPALLPTPDASMGTGGRVSATPGGERESGAKRSIPLSDAVTHFLPTPTAMDSHSSSGRNPDWGHGTTLTDAAQSTGETTGPPSAGGRPSPGGQFPGQLSLDELENG